MGDPQTSTLQGEPGDIGWVAIARLLRPQGRKGELLADLLTDLELDNQFRPGRLISLAKPQSIAPGPNTTPTALEGHWLPLGKNSGRIVLKLTGCDSISAAELLAGQQVMVPAQEMPALDDDTYYVSDLIGCTLLDASNPAGPTPVGVIGDVQFVMAPDGKTRLPDAAPLLGLELTGAGPDSDLILVPFVQNHLDSVNLAAKQIIMRIPEGLLDPDLTASIH